MVCFMHSVSWVVCGSCQVHECPALELVQIVGKPASRAPSVQGTARPSIFPFPQEPLVRQNGHSGQLCGANAGDPR